MKIECPFYDEAKLKCTHKKGDGICTLPKYCKPSRELHRLDGDLR